MRTTCPSCHKPTLGLLVLVRAWFRTFGACPSCGAHFLFSPWSAAASTLGLFAVLFLFIWVAGQLHSVLSAVALFAMWVALVGVVHLFVPVCPLPTTVRRHRLLGLVVVVLAVVWLVVANTLGSNGANP